MHEFLLGFAQRLLYS